MFRMCYIPLVLLSVSGIQAADSVADSSAEATDALESAFRISPVYWDQNISVVDICGCESEASVGMLLWPASTGELLKLMDALKYEYEMQSFQCVVFSLVEAKTEPEVQKMLLALKECVTMCDMLRIPLRIAIGRDGSWLDVTPTYPVASARYLMVQADAKMVLAEAEGSAVVQTASLAELQPYLTGSADKPAPVNIMWAPSAANYAGFVALIEACDKLNVDYSLYLLP